MLKGFVKKKVSISSRWLQFFICTRDSFLGNRAFNNLSMTLSTSILPIVCRYYLNENAEHGFHRILLLCNCSLLLRTLKVQNWIRKMFSLNNAHTWFSQLNLSFETWLVTIPSVAIGSVFCFLILYVRWKYQRLSCVLLL